MWHTPEQVKDRKDLPGPALILMGTSLGIPCHAIYFFMAVVLGQGEVVGMRDRVAGSEETSKGVPCGGVLSRQSATSQLLDAAGQDPSGVPRYLKRFTHCCAAMAVREALALIQSKLPALGWFVRLFRRLNFL